METLILSTPVHKGRLSNNPSNFQPAAVVSILAKVLEKTVSDQLGNYLENNRQLNNQHLSVLPTSGSLSLW